MGRFVLIILYWAIALILIALTISGLHEIRLGAIWKALIGGSSFALAIWLHKLFFPIPLPDKYDAEGTQGHQRTPPTEAVHASASTPSGGSRTVNNEDLWEKTDHADAEETSKKPDLVGEQVEMASENIDAKNDPVPETSDITESADGWSEEFQILFEYDPIVKECHDELESLDPQLSN